MRLTSKLAILLTSIIATACASAGPNVTLGLGPITCPPSLLTQTEGPEAVDPNFVSSLSAANQRYVTRREAQWETALDEANTKGDDALETCAEYNRRLRALERGGGNLGPAS